MTEEYFTWDEMIELGALTPPTLSSGRIYLLLRNKKGYELYRDIQEPDNSDLIKQIF